MQKADIKIIAIKDKSRRDAALFYINHVEGLVKILDADFEVWSNFDCWENISVQQWFFLRAMDLFLGKRCKLGKLLEVWVPLVELVVGSSGFGKTTLFNLLLRVYDPAAGTVFLDD